LERVRPDVWLIDTLPIVVDTEASSDSLGSE